MKKFLVMLLTVSLLFGLSSTTSRAASKKSTELSTSKTTITIAANEKTENKVIQLKNYKKIKKSDVKKVKWTSSNKKVATVKVSGKYGQKCTITAKNTGKVTIKVKFNGKSYKCKVTIIKASNNNSNNTTNNKNTQSTTETKKPQTAKENSTRTPSTNIPSTTTEAPTKTYNHNCNNFLDLNHGVYHEAETVYDYGYTIFTCTICGKEVKVEDTIRKADTYTVKTEKIEPTCTKDGSATTYKIYGDGRKVVTNTEVLKALGHDYEETWSHPKCPHEKQIVTSHCKRCGYTTTISQNISEYYIGNEAHDVRDFDNVHYEVTLHPDNFDDAYQTAYGTCGACMYEKVCNVCQDRYCISNDSDCYEIFNTMIPSWKISHKVYLNVTNSTVPTNETEYNNGYNTYYRSGYNKILEMVDGTVTVSNGVYTITEK